MSANIIHVRTRTAADLKTCGAILRRVHELDGYPVEGVADTDAWLNPPTLIKAWVAMLDHQIVGHSLLTSPTEHDEAARLWQDFLFSDQGQILWLKGFAHPARFNDLAKRGKIPKALLNALPPAALYAKAKFASVAQQTAAKNLIVAQWPSKVGA